MKILSDGNLVIDDTSYFYGNVTINSLQLETNSKMVIGSTCDVTVNSITGDISGVGCTLPECE
jgi:hypothetical protein